MKTVEIVVQREPSAGKATLGVCFVDDVFTCFALEDVIREVPDQDVSAWKVYGETAIPSGRFRVVITYSQHFDRLLPELLGVPGFEGIRLHPGNGPTDTEGCILLGLARSSASVENSRAACAAVQLRIEQAIAAGLEVWCTVKNPPLWWAAQQAAAAAKEPK